MSKKIDTIDIIIPTYNNPEMLGHCVSSIGSKRLGHPVRVIVVNNGHPDSLNMIGSEPWMEIVQTGGKNLGWEGGLKEGLKRSKSEFVVFMNDDTFVPHSEVLWLRKMSELFCNPDVAAVGPCTNVVMGKQNMLYRTPHTTIEATYLIGFCMMVRRKHLDEVGGVDDTLPGGDDLDLSIRFRKAGYALVNKRDVFVFHYGYQTGSKLYGDQNKKGGWNSREMNERTKHALIVKHGFYEWFKCIASYEHDHRGKNDDHEGEIIREHVWGEKVLDLGCGNNKTIPNAVGVDIIKKGDAVPFIDGKSDADVVANIERKLPFATGTQDTVISRHFLEHCIDTVGSLKEWSRVLQHDGRLIIAVPNEELLDTIPMNGEHVHAFTPDSLKSVAHLLGLKRIHLQGTNSGSFVSVFQKNGVN